MTAGHVPVMQCLHICVCVYLKVPQERKTTNTTSVPSRT